MLLGWKSDDIDGNLKRKTPRQEVQNLTWITLVMEDNCFLAYILYSIMQILGTPFECYDKSSLLIFFVSVTCW